MSNNFPIINLLQNARDGVTKAIMVVDYSHHEVHSGSAFYAEGTTNMSDTEQLAIKIVTPNSAKECHFTWDIAASGVTEILLYEDAVGGMAGGVSVTPLNENRNSTKTSSMALTRGVTTSTAVGVQLHDWISGQVTAGGFFSADNVSGGGSGRGTEIMLKTNSTYLGIIKSNSTGNNVSFRTAWYEHAPSTGLKVAD